MRYFLHFGILENAFTTTQNALNTVASGGLRLSTLPVRALPLHPHWGHSPHNPFVPSSTIFWIYH